MSAHYIPDQWDVDLSYDGKSDMVREFLRQATYLAEAIDAACGNYGIDADAYRNHAIDAVQLLLDDSDASHVLSLPTAEHLDLFGPMSLVRAAIKEFELDEDQAEWLIERYSEPRREYVVVAVEEGRPDQLATLDLRTREEAEETREGMTAYHAEHGYFAGLDRPNVFRDVRYVVRRVA